MKKYVGIFLVILVLGVVLSQNLSLEIKRIDDQLYGSDSEFEVFFNSRGYEIYYKWKDRMYIKTLGEVAVNINYIGNKKNLSEESTLYYDYDFGIIAGSGKIVGFTGDGKKVSWTSHPQVRPIKEGDYTVYFKLDDVESEVTLRRE
ncbi:MAG: hypothetical protein PWQ12_1742 [Clostridiales bacterium]|jgi:hypothetical protein|nr:hypothetical protein [Clostridiales bacterium]